ncbi:glycerol-3-phosphate 1-O-acyltransferase PlsB [Halomonas sp. M4R1S46]|uniref:glycerol-3-phosphate 1-O-acyltransferase PlsB n=1 Tax=Halomonas sp. M4R1S46 TaxID=2982692 RepID=UPI0021E3CCE3|nr:glycerol-3-phosphate 1-O-acyltransferase PlsB [Halomonas sp. M4R1S46]UYG08435.1 glycerol-3-phosphate 1-O-acyltransferase PlsB [Halomonas sp. M4R1S46]
MASPISALHVPLRRLLTAWVQVRRIEPAPEALGLDPALPTVYVLPRSSLSDALLLESLAHRHGLPPADARQRLGEHEVRTRLALPSLRRRLWPRRPHGGAPFEALIAAGRALPQDIQLVPVSVFWGRAPGKRFGLWHLLAADSWRLTGRLRRLLSVAVNGRDVEVYFGAPLRLSELDDGREPALTNRKAARLLRVHFRRVRIQVLGPDLSHHRTLVEGVVGSPEVRRVIEELAGDDPRARARLRRRARRYGREIASNMSYPVMRFLHGALRRLWNRLYDGVDVQGLEAIKALAGNHTLVYVPCHRSHIDYLLLSYVLYDHGLMPPHIAAGRNLDMPLVGPLLRRGGAFFMRRSFRGQPLYAGVFSEYLHRLLAAGHPLEYFIEGGRSRSGRMLPAQPGMLAMTLGSFLRSRRHGAQPLAFVPVYIGYERVLEDVTYQRELAGSRKRKETPLGLLRVLGRLRQPHGRVAVNIGEPLELAAFLDRQRPDWRDAAGEGRPGWCDEVVPRLGEALTRRINAAAALNPVNLVALGLLATPHHAIEADLLERQLALLVDLRRPRPGGPQRGLPAGSPRDWLDEARALGLITYRPHPLGDIVTADERQASLLGWYRNNVLHLFALPGITAFAFRHHAYHASGDLEALLAPIWPVLARELSLESPPSLRIALDEILAQLGAAGLLERDGDGWRRPASLTGDEQLRMLGRLMQPSLERGYLLLSALLGEPPGHFTARSLGDHARQLAERLAQLTGRAAPEFFDARLFAGLVASLEAEGWLWLDEGRLHYARALRETASRSRALFAPALRHRLQRVARQSEA